MADSFLELYVGTTASAKTEDAEAVDFGGGVTRYRQRNQVAGALSNEIARVMASTPGGSEMGLVVRVVGATTSTTITNVVPGVTGTALGKAIAATVGANDTGVGAWAQRRDTLVTLTPADGQYTPMFLSSRGALWTVNDEMEQVFGSVAHDSPDAHPPVKGGLKATAALVSAVTEGDVANLSGDLFGRLRVLPPLIDTDDESIARNQTMPVAASVLYAGDGLGLTANARKPLQSIGNNLLVHEAAAKGTTTVTQVTVNNSTTNGVSLIAANSAGTRRRVVVTNHSTEVVYINTGNLTAGGTSVGEALAGVVGAEKSFYTANALRATVVTGPVTVSVREEVLA